MKILYTTGALQLDYNSCEMIHDLYKRIREKYNGRTVIIDVPEDGENGCQITFD